MTAVIWPIISNKYTIEEKQSINIQYSEQKNQILNMVDNDFLSSCKLHVKLK